jgi:hypothetical protein
MKYIRSSRAAGPRWLTSMLLSFVVMTSPACRGQSGKPATTDAPATANSARVKAPIGTRLELTLTGYNYTNRYIDQFDVDGQGGGDIDVSGPRSAGNGSACCVSYRSGVPARKVKVRWQADACTFVSYIDEEGKKHERTHSYLREVEVQVDPNIPDFPRYFEVHFYPDGHVEAAMTEHESGARLVLSKDREDNSNFPRCPNDTEPKE